MSPLGWRWDWMFFLIQGVSWAKYGPLGFLIQPAELVQILKYIYVCILAILVALKWKLRLESKGLRTLVVEVTTPAFKITTQGHNHIQELDCETRVSSIAEKPLSLLTR